MSQKPDPRLDAMPQELLDQIMDDVDKKGLLSLRQVNKALHQKTTDRAWKAYLSQVTIFIADEEDLRRAVELSKNAIARHYIQETILLVDEFSAQEDHDITMESSRMISLLKRSQEARDAIALWDKTKAEQVQLQKTGRDVQLLTEYFANLAQNGRPQTTLITSQTLLPPDVPRPQVLQTYEAAFACLGPCMGLENISSLASAPFTRVPSAVSQSSVNVRTFELADMTPIRDLVQDPQLLPL